MKLIVMLAALLSACGPEPDRCTVRRDAQGRVVEVWIDGEFAAAYWYDGAGRRIVFEEVPGADLGLCGGI